MLSQELVDDRCDKTVGGGLGAADRQFADRRVLEELQLLHALLEFVEHGGPTPQQGITVERGLDALRVAIEQPQAEGVLEIGDRLRDRGLGHCELDRGLSHAA
jgi:hypothetical protein